MTANLHTASNDPRIPAGFLAQENQVWENGIRHAR